MTALVIRSAPWTVFEAAAPNAPVPPPWDLLEHPAARSHAAGHPAVAKVHIFPSSGPFRAWSPAGRRAIRELRGKNDWERVYVLAAYDDDARHGARHLALEIGGTAVEVLYPDGKTEPVSRRDTTIREAIRIAAFLPLTLLAAAIGIAVLLGAALRAVLSAVHAVKPVPPDTPRVSKVPNDEGESARKSRADLSVIVVTWNAAADIGDMLDSVSPDTHRAKLDVIVSDNGSTDATREIAGSRSWVRILESAKNHGYAGGFNIALDKACGRYIAVANSDIVVQPGALDRLVAYLDAHEDVGAAAPRMLDAHNRPQRGFQVRRFPSVAGLAAERTIWRRFLSDDVRAAYTMEDFDDSEPCQVDQPAGAFLAVRREVLESVGGMDNEFFILFEDVDWCRRIRHAGWRIAHVPAAEIIHGKSHSLVMRGAGLSLEYDRSMTRYFDLHHGAVESFLLHTAFGTDAIVQGAAAIADGIAGSRHGFRAAWHHGLRAALHTGIAP